MRVVINGQAANEEQVNISNFDLKHIKCGSTVQIVGGRRSGKTTLLLHMLRSMINDHDACAVINMLPEEKEVLRSVLPASCFFDGVSASNVEAFLEGLHGVEATEVRCNVLVIYGRRGKKDSLVTPLFRNGRHVRTTVIEYGDVFDICSSTRMNTDYFFLFGTSNDEEKQKISNLLGNGLTDFVSTFDAMTCDKRTAVYMSKHASSQAFGASWSSWSVLSFDVCVPLFCMSLRAQYRHIYVNHLEQSADLVATNLRGENPNTHVDLGLCKEMHFESPRTDYMHPATEKFMFVFENLPHPLHALSTVSLESLSCTVIESSEPRYVQCPSTIKCVQSRPLFSCDSKAETENTASLTSATDAQKARNAEKQRIERVFVDCFSKKMNAPILISFYEGIKDEDNALEWVVRMSKLL